MIYSKVEPQASANVIFDFDLTIFPEESTASLVTTLIEGDEKLNHFLNEYKSKNKSIADKISDAKNYFTIISKIKKSTLKNFTENSRHLINPIFNELIVDLKKNNIKPHIISAGYIEIISPLVNRMGIPNSDIAANRFLWFNNQAICIIPSMLNKAIGKVEIVRRWKSAGKLKGPVIMVGDGLADRNVYLHGLADGFIQANYYIKPEQHDSSENFLVSSDPRTLKNQLSDIFERIRNTA